MVTRAVGGRGANCGGRELGIGPKRDTSDTGGTPIGRGDNIGVEAFCPRAAGVTGFTSITDAGTGGREAAAVLAEGGGGVETTASLWRLMVSCEYLAFS